MTLGVVGPTLLALNLVLSKYILKEDAFNVSIVIASIFLVSGAIIAIVFANYDSYSYDI